MKHQSINKHGHEEGKDHQRGMALEDLNLAMNDIAFGQGIENLADALKQTPSDLYRLNLSGNSLGVEGGKCLAEALAMNTTIAHLDLSGTPTQPNIEAQGVRALSQSLKMPNPLRQLQAGLQPGASWTPGGT